MHRCRALATRLILLLFFSLIGFRFDLFSVSNASTPPTTEPPPPIPTLRILPKLNLDASRVSISGVSSGAFMAVQMHLAYSSLIKGVGSIAGGIWECAKGDSTRAQSICMHSPSQIVTKDYLELVRQRASRNEIDALANLHDSRIFLFASQRDSIVRPVASEKLAEFYQSLAPAVSIRQTTHASAAHGFLTIGYGNRCSMTGLPWLINCGEDLAGEILLQTDPHRAKFAAPGVADNAAFVFFDQKAVVGSRAIMFDWGAAYIPRACTAASAQCGLHVALHGCQMNPDFISRQFIDHAGYNEWAETNDLVVLYPQAAKSNNNPNACWDWFGYTGADYTSKSGRQIQALRALMKTLGI